jgi:NAD(P)-dependent dehydrogenase (short-subunit alcohol dehydrogenase family)
MGVMVVTGAARGIGAACARALAGRTTLLLCDLEETALDGIVEELASQGQRAERFAGDLTQESVVETLAKRVEAAGGLAGLAHCAGLSGAQAPAEKIIEINLVATARLLTALQPQVEDGAAAVCIASQAGHFTRAGLPAEAAALLVDPLQDGLFAKLEGVLGDGVTGASGAYGVSKRGVQLLAVKHAPAWGARGGRVVSVSPGIVETDMGRAEYAKNTVAIDSIMERTPAGNRMGQVEEIASVVAFLCSEGASFVSGVDWMVDGGSTNQLIGG